MDRTRIVVGYDGSDESRRAVDWAADEAGRTGAPLQIVHTYQVGWPAGGYYRPTAEESAAVRGRAERLAADAADAVRARGTGINVVATVVHAAPAATLLDIAHSGARLLVVGGHGAGGVADLLAGSVSQQVAMHARVPVVVVRGPGAPDGPVVAGVDGSPATGTALGLAFEAAAAAGAPLVAVRTYVPPAPSVLPLSAVEADERAALRASLAGWPEKYPSVGLEARLTAGRAAKVLIGLSRTARLVVVGSRGHGGFTGLLLGSVGQRLVQHAQCPVLVAHPNRASTFGTGDAFRL
ncbi:universal stress protein [Dactylosporangium aurantiacum]|uniref:Universal stress protein n=1 Tax=Dactylosporangium aurantiacum TaxID=35754 RepID=A0A9Q9MKE8_9ACTN|nr:universal stress protein [Dactylosporangium aurantiacum]MDG6105917.1 universal stress protein [Dactylosporangium aurantiacum]UWZ57910.1 universal stress protein [Dactylosporangium aurantiacum]